MFYFCNLRKDFLLSFSFRSDISCFALLWDLFSCRWAFFLSRNSRIWNISGFRIGNFEIMEVWIIKSSLSLILSDIPLGKSWDHRWSFGCRDYWTFGRLLAQNWLICWFFQHTLSPWHSSHQSSSGCRSLKSTFWSCVLH